MINTWQEIFYPEIDSTNEEAKRLLTKGNNLIFSVIWAGKQTKGKGRYDRVWSSPIGNLYSSFIIKNEQTNYLSFLSALSIIETIKELKSDIEVFCKWPNDVLIEGKKISGILLEVCDDAMIIGIGVNINSCPTSTTYPAAALSDFGITTTAEDFLKILGHKINLNLNLLKKEGFLAIRANWLKFAYGIGNKIQVNLINESTSGIFKGISEQGALLLESEEELKQIMAGDVFYL